MDLDAFFCKIYVDTDREKSWLVEAIASYLSAESLRDTIDSDLIVVDVCKNEDFDATRRSVDDDFVFFRYYLDVVPGQAAERATYIATVNSLLALLWNNGCRAVAACDFEDELVSRGGYRPDRPGKK
jgi:hypothetical protein